jgi:arylsulfatase A-like enzyme
MAARKSVVLVTVDCLRAGHCGFMGYQRPTTPFLDGLAGESFVFPTAIVAGAPTYYSFPAILASRYPLALGREVSGLAPEETNLASVLKKNAYATAFFGAGNPYLSARFGYDFGFDTFRDFLDDAPLSTSDGSESASGWPGNLNRALAIVSHKIPGVGAAYDELYFQYCQRWAAPPAKSLEALRRFPAADVIVDHASKWLASVGENPFFLWLHFMDPHSPYYPTEEGLELFGANRPTAARARYLNGCWNRFDVGSQRLRRHRDEVISLYDSGIRWADVQVSRLVGTLRQLKHWDDCIFAFTADHGEEFLEHDRRYHEPSLVEELIHVPLVLRVPGAARRTLPGAPFSLLHLAPTLLAAAGLPVPAEFQGQSHWKHIQGGTGWNEPAIAECVVGCTNPFLPELRCGARLLAVREARYKLLLNFDARTEYLFDLEADPGEKAPVPAVAAKPERRLLLEAALTHLKSCGARQVSEAYLRARLREISLNFSKTAATAGTSAVGWVESRRLLRKTE